MRNSKQQGLASLGKEILIFVLVFYSTYFCLNYLTTKVFFLCRVQQTSMETTLLPNQILLGKYQPFTNAKLIHYEGDENCVYLTINTFFLGGLISGIFFDRQRANMRSIGFCYDYPLPMVKYWRKNQALEFLASYVGKTNASVFPVLFRRGEKASLVARNGAEPSQTFAVPATAQGIRPRPGSGATWL